MRSYLFVLMVFVTTYANSQPFEIRGVLPWHNFLSGPTVWNENDYEKYLDECQKNGINFIAFHNYTGGGERYFNYVEPMIKIQYKNVLPETSFDHSGTARWGYLPMKVKDFAFGTDKLFKLPPGAEYFGAECAITAKNNEERYEKAQALMQKVLKMAHSRNMQMAMGFEFGVAPPEYASIRTQHDMYWTGTGSLVYNPFDPDAIGILYATIDNILETYKGIDWVYLWLNEHCMFGIDTKIGLRNKSMAQFYSENEKYYASEGVNESLKFLGVWAQAYIQKAYDYIKKKAPGTKIAIGGWGSENQMALLLKGLDKSLPGDIVFSMLNPNMGEKPHPDYFKEIAKHRNVWAIPWLEGDASLWHLQPRVNTMRSHVKKASDDQLNGVVAIHWRTEEIKPNFEAFSYFANNPGDTLSTEKIYEDYCTKQYGVYARNSLAPVLTRTDISGLLKSIASPVYFAYTPRWGRLTNEQKENCKSTVKIIDQCLSNEKEGNKVVNLKWLKSNYEFSLLLDSVSRSMEPAWKIRDEALPEIGTTNIDKQKIKEAQESLKKAPIEKLFAVFVSKIRSTGELGELSSINQRVWGEYQLLNQFLQEYDLH